MRIGASITNKLFTQCICFDKKIKIHIIKIIPRNKKKKKIYIKCGKWDVQIMNDKNNQKICIKNIIIHIFFILHIFLLLYIHCTQASLTRSGNSDSLSFYSCECVCVELCTNRMIENIIDQRTNILRHEMICDLSRN